jgi:DNA-binding transcriptional MerR regulator
MRHLDTHEPTVKTKDALLTTGEMARRSSNTLRTVRFYEEEGILRPLRRTEGGHRLFDEDELERLMLVSDLRSAGLSLDEIKDLLALKESSGSAADHAATVLTERMDELRQKLATLSRLQKDLAATTEALRRAHDGTDVGGSSEPMPRALRVLWGRPTPASAAE